ncbi:nucleotidyltransferase family protein [Acaryochloris sp. IP29b_bin.148]|uniref:nucleotidyltransferase domain-containing protein n=1 Tax=Acaryochloris sp. IP29b_bin.148 TaxID=2969218 RepID=UPI00261CEC0A|nr:nucleotidyltransferase family protein [Acaryochloris sp. IP29b_bin.148]
MQVHNLSPNLALSREQQLLLCLAHPQIKDAVAEKIHSLLLAGINWPLFLEQVEHHWVMMQIYPHLKQWCSSTIPASLLSQLEVTYFANTARNLLLVTELLKLLQLLTAHDIVAIPFKGPILAVSAYGHLARRQFSDLDILVAPADFHRALALLNEQAGYQKLPTTYRLYPHEYPLVSADGNIFIDLHQQIAGKDFFTFPLQFEEMTQRLQDITLLHASVPCFHPEDVLLILCVHGSKHGWELLSWICDFATFVHIHADLDWSRLYQKAQTLGCDRMLSIGLTLSNELLGVPIPANYPQKSDQTLVLNRIKTQIYRRCFAPDQQVTSELSWEKVLLHVRLLSRVQDQRAYLNWCAQRLFTPTYKDINQIPLPQSLSFLYYLLRPLRLVGLLK